MKPWTAIALALAVGIPGAIAVAPTQAVAQCRECRTLSPAEVRELRRQLGDALNQRDTARGSAAVQLRRASNARADLRRVTEIFGLPPDTSQTAIVEQLERWAEQDQQNREELARLNEIVSRIESGEVRDAAEAHLRDAQASFDDGRLENADAALARLEVLRRSAQAEVRQLWIDSVLARSTLADQRLDGEMARRLAREARIEERNNSNHTQWRLLMREADSYSLEDPRLRDNSALEAAMILYRDEALPLLDRARDPEDWADTQIRLGNTLRELGEREFDNERLEASVEAYEAALQEYPRDKKPLTWAGISNNLGLALVALSRTEIGTERLEAAVEAFEAALQERTRERNPLSWARSQNSLGIALSHLGEREGNPSRLEEAVRAYEAALREQTRERYPRDWASVQTNLGNTLAELAVLGPEESRAARLEAAIQAYDAAVLGWDRDQEPLNWAKAQSNKGTALKRLGEHEGNVGRLEASLTAYEAALTAYEASLEEYTRDRVPVSWATVQWNMGNVLSILGQRESGTARLEAAVQAYEAALLERTRERFPLDWAATEIGRAVPLYLIGERQGDRSRFEVMREPLLEIVTIYRQMGLFDAAEAVNRVLQLMHTSP
jgi:tetratricopeptide (TPR) repeat protein